MAGVIRGEFERFRSLVERLLPENPPFLPGASEDELALLETELRMPLPAELRTMLSVANGQDRRVSPDGPIAHQRFLTVDEILFHYSSLRFAVSDLTTPTSQPSYFTDVVYSPMWIPFAELVDQHFMVDLAPGELGTRGQVFCRYNCPEEDPPDVPSLAKFLKQISDGVEDGRIPVCDNTFDYLLSVPG